MKEQDSVLLSESRDGGTSSIRCVAVGNAWHGVADSRRSAVVKIAMGEKDGVFAPW